MVGEADNGQRLVEAARRLKPDVVVLDVSMPVLNGIDAARQIAEALPATQIVVLSMHTSPMYIEKGNGRWREGVHAQGGRFRAVATGSG